MEIRTANLDDIEQIMRILAFVIRDMKLCGNPQWDENYPQRTDFENDIKAGNLLAAVKDGNIMGFMCVDKNQVAEYGSVAWKYEGKAFFIHRTAVSPEFRRRGIASFMINWAEKLARENGADVIRTDTYCENSDMNRFFIKHGYEKAGTVVFRGIAGDFNCYEKRLNES